MFYDMSIDVADSCDVQEAMDKLFTPDILEEIINIKQRIMAFRMR